MPMAHRPPTIEISRNKFLGDGTSRVKPATSSLECEKSTQVLRVKVESNSEGDVVQRTDAASTSASPSAFSSPAALFSAARLLFSPARSQNHQVDPTEVNFLSMYPSWPGSLTHRSEIN